MVFNLGEALNMQEFNGHTESATGLVAESALRR